MRLYDLIAGKNKSSREESLKGSAGQTEQGTMRRIEPRAAERSQAGRRKPQIPEPEERRLAGQVSLGLGLRQAVCWLLKEEHKRCKYFRLWARDLKALTPQES